jgi:hypothetical protein
MPREGGGPGSGLPSVPRKRAGRREAGPRSGVDQNVYVPWNEKIVTDAS